MGFAPSINLLVLAMLAALRVTPFPLREIDRVSPTFATWQKDWQEDWRPLCWSKLFMRPKKYYIHCDFGAGAQPRIIEGSVEARRLKAFGPFTSQERAEETAMWLLYGFETRTWGAYDAAPVVCEQPAKRRRPRLWAYPSSGYRWVDLSAITPRDKLTFEPTTA